MMNYTACSNADGAIGYYGRAGSELERAGRWQGHGARDLGLYGEVDLADWRKLVRRKGPNGEKLCQKNRDNGRCGHDITFSVNKPTAILLALADDAVRGVVEKANEATMELVEGRMVARVKGELVQTGNMINAPFPHEITRSRDPGFHVHNFVANATKHQGQWYAPEMRRVVESSALITAFFHNEVARGLRGLGYQTEPTKDNYRIVGIPDSACRKLSSRREDINQEQASRDAALSEQIKACADTVKLRELEGKQRHIRSPKGRAALAVLTREKKKDALDPAKLKREWQAKLTPYEREAIDNTYRQAHGLVGKPSGKADPLSSALERLGKAMEASQKPQESPEAARVDKSPLYLAQALETALQADSRVTEERLLTLALKIGVGEVTLPSLQAALPELDAIRAGGQVSTRAALKMEEYVTDYARRGKLAWVKNRVDGLPDAGKMTFPELHAMVARAGEKHLVIAGDARNQREGQPLKVLREIVGMKPIGEPARAKRPSVVSVAPTLKGWKARMKSQMSLIRKLNPWRQPEDVNRVRTQEQVRER